MWISLYFFSHFISCGRTVRQSPFRKRLCFQWR
nr:MAG TPA: cAMP-dependent protein kinase inhibitor [Caudoviricetes sp.]